MVAVLDCREIEQQALSVEKRHLEGRLFTEEPPLLQFFDGVQGDNFVKWGGRLLGVAEEEDVVTLLLLFRGG